MASYEQIDDTQRILDVYRQMKDHFGADVMKSHRMAVGSFLDIAPKLTPCAKALSLAIYNDVPRTLFSRRANKSEVQKTARSAASFLESKGVAHDIALDTLEGICLVLGIPVSVRPDYSQGGMIPYEKMESKSIGEAISKLNHIRWFLNHEDEYQWNVKRDRLVNLRRLMNFPTKNHDEIEKEYRDITRGFFNDPYNAWIIVDQPKDTNSAFTASSIDKFFVVIQGEPVAVGFASEFPGNETKNALHIFEVKKKAFQENVDKLRKKAEQVTVTENPGQSQELKKGSRYLRGSIFWAALLLGCLVWINKHSLFPNWFLYLFSRLKSPVRILTDLPMFGTYRNLGYEAGLAIYTVAWIIEIFLVIQIIKTIRRSQRMKHLAGAPERRKKALERLFESEIAGDIHNLDSIIGNAWDHRTGSMSIAPHDYRELIRNAETAVDQGSTKKIVTAGGKGLKNIAAILSLGFLLVVAGVVPWYGYYGYMYPNLFAYGDALEGSNQGGLTTYALEENRSVYLTETDWSEINSGAVTEAVVNLAAATSTLKLGDGQDYSAWNVTDVDLRTSWQEGSDGPGIGERLEIDFDRSYQIQYLYIEPANNYSEEVYWMNNRIRTISFEAGNQTLSYQFSDIYGKGYCLKLSEPITSDHVIATIEGVYSGSRYDDTCIAEFHAYGN